MKYPSDLTTKQWNMIKHLFENENRGKHFQVHKKRKLVNAVLYINKTGCQWRQLPHDFPPYTTVSSFYQRAVKSDLWAKVLEFLVRKSREQVGRKPEPSYALIDSQSVKTTSASEERGINGGKKIKGRKRHIVTDIKGNLLCVIFHAANIHDTVAGGEVICLALEKHPTIKGVCADAGYRKTFK